MKRRNKIFCALLSFLLLLSLTACGAGTIPAGETPTPNSKDTVTLTDALGREVTLRKNPQRVAALIGSFADVWCLAGGRDVLVAAANDSWTQFQLELGEEVANLGSISQPNLETLLAAEPDLVIASSKTESNLELRQTLERAGIPVVYFNVSTLEDYLSMLKLCTELTGMPENYRLYGEDVQQRVEQARIRVPAEGEARTVLYVRATGSSVKVKNSRDTVLGEMLADLGCVNIADREEALLEDLSMETIVVEDPDYIFVVLQGTDTSGAEKNLENALLSNPAWNTLTAVREGRVFMMDQRLYNVKPNALWGEAYEKLADILYPENQ